MPVTYNPGDIELKEVLLYNPNKKFAEIRHLTVEFNIFNNLFTNGNKCELVMTDSNGLIEMLPIVGDETLVVRFKTPTAKEHLTYVFRIYGVTERAKSTQRGEVYVLHGVSIDVINNHRNSVNKTYKDLRADQIVKAVYNTYLRPTEAEYGIIKAKHPLHLTETKYNHSFTFTGEKPFDAINYICKEAQAKGDELAGNFVFFEKEDGWHLETIESMLEKDAVDDFYLAEAAAPNEKKDKGKQVYPYQKISNLEFVNHPDSIRNLESGLYGHTVETIDPIRKIFQEETFRWKDDFNKLKHIEKKTTKEHLIPPKSVFGTDFNSSKSHHIVSHIGTSEFYTAEVKDNDQQIRNPRRLHKSLKYDTASRAQLGNIILNVGIPGNTDIEIGDIINLHIPQTSGVEEYKKKLNLLYDKRFLVTAVRHTYNKVQNNFFTVLECVKDTYAKKAVEEGR